MSSFRYARHISRACSPRGRPMRRAFEAPLLASLAAPSRRPFTTTSAAPLERKAKMPLPIGSSLKVPHPDTPSLRPPSAFKPTHTRITTLPNGVRVASEETYGQASCVGVFVNGGSRNETLETNGTTHLLQRMGYKATTNRTSGQIVRALENLGVNAMSSSSRECMVYTTEVTRGCVGEVVEILADSVINPILPEEDIAEQKIAISRELEDLVNDPAAWIPEILHELAYGPQGLGLSQICPPPNLENLGRAQLRHFIDTHYVGPRVAVVGAGVDHDEFVKLVEKHFSSLPSSSKHQPIHVPVQYKGGSHVEIMTPDAESRLKDMMAEQGKNPPSHIALVFEGTGLNDPDLYATCVLQSLMGGGSSFSSGGPGKGMYTRLYRRVLNEYSWVESATCLNAFYNDAGLFGIYGTAEHSHLGRMLEVMCFELVDLTQSIDDEELHRAKNQLRSGIFMNLESRAVMCDDIGRQVVSCGERKSAEELCELIEKVSPDDLRRVARRILSSAPTLAVYTPEKHVKRLPDYDRLCSWLTQVLQNLDSQQVK